MLCSRITQRVPNLIHGLRGGVDIQQICPHMVIYIIYCWPASNWLVPWHLGGYIF